MPYALPDGGKLLGIDRAWSGTGQQVGRAQRGRHDVGLSQLQQQGAGRGAKDAIFCRRPARARRGRADHRHITGQKGLMQDAHEDRAIGGMVKAGDHGQRDQGAMAGDREAQVAPIGRTGLPHADVATGIKSEENRLAGLAQQGLNEARGRPHPEAQTRTADRGEWRPGEMVGRRGKKFHGGKAPLAVRRAADRND